MVETEADMTRRIEALETKVSYQEATIAELSKELYEHALALERFERHYRDLAAKLKEVSGEGMPPLPTNERPPHY